DRISIVQPGGLYVDQFKNWSTPLFSFCRAKRECLDHPSSPFFIMIKSEPNAPVGPSSTSANTGRYFFAFETLFSTD
ncbi:MAG: hypothetical protein IJP64_03790, partial [Oscillospiraceae bacterium]|nr:hypothetical protein [Oscillospiraceae bacterium]